MKIVWRITGHGAFQFHDAYVGPHMCGRVVQGPTAYGWQLHLPTTPTITAGQADTLRQAKASLADAIEEWLTCLPTTKI